LKNTLACKFLKAYLTLDKMPLIEMLINISMLIYKFIYNFSILWRKNKNYDFFHAIFVNHCNIIISISQHIFNFFNKYYIYKYYAYSNSKIIFSVLIKIILELTSKFLILKKVNNNSLSINNVWILFFKNFLMTRIKKLE